MECTFLSRLRRLSDKSDTSESEDGRFFSASCGGWKLENVGKDENDGNCINKTKGWQSDLI